MSYLERLQAKATLKATGSAPAKGAKGGFDPFASVGVARFHELPAACADGFARLQAMPPPRITRPEVWSEIVADALRLAADGWAMQALALGWTSLDLWGCSPVARGNPDHGGLAVWLDGRRILLLDERTCIVDAGAGARAVFTRREPAVGMLLWDLGKAAC